MISKDLTRDIKIAIKTAMGQLSYVQRQIDDAHKAEDVLLQLKAVQAMLSKVSYKLLDETHRKALAEKIVANYESCPGDCGNEIAIEKMMRFFPEMEVEEIPEKLKEAVSIEREIHKLFSQKNLDTPPT